MTEYEFYLVNSLEKIFPDQKPSIMDEGTRIAILKGEVPAIQLVYKRKRSNVIPDFNQEFEFQIKGLPTAARLRDVELVPSSFPCNEITDDNYISTKPGLFPDLLRPKKDNIIIPLTGQYRSIWIDFPGTDTLPAGLHKVEIIIKTRPVVTFGNGSINKLEDEEKQTKVLSFLLEVSDIHLPEQTLIHTEWFHADCLANYYQAEVFSEKHWDIIENQIMLAGRELGINMLLTPVFTPPLDTAIDCERTTVQLVDIFLENNKYTFDFTKLKRWCKLCKKYGILYLEIPHLFTQWGAKATPKILATVNGVQQKLFGWHVTADNRDYKDFLEQFIPALQHELLTLGFDKEHIYFHISDEPGKSDEESYAMAKKVVSGLLDGWNVIDALSEYLFYEKGLVKNPVPSSDHIQKFIDNNVSNLWVYYCCGQNYKVPNRFFAMPSARNRIMGVLMYLYNIKGFLHWGYNFYNSKFSKELIDPFFDTHASYAFPSGDSYLVYPGKDGTAWSSIRAEVQREGLYDLRALNLLESFVGRERVEQIIYDGEMAPFTFKSYPINGDYLINLRRKIALEIDRILFKENQ